MSAATLACTSCPLAVRAFATAAPRTTLATTPYVTQRLEGPDTRFPPVRLTCGSVAPNSADRQRWGTAPTRLNGNKDRLGPAVGRQRNRMLDGQLLVVALQRLKNPPSFSKCCGEPPQMFLLVPDDEAIVAEQELHDGEAIQANSGEPRDLQGPGRRQEVDELISEAVEEIDAAPLRARSPERASPGGGWRSPRIGSCGTGWGTSRGAPLGRARELRVPATTWQRVSPGAGTGQRCHESR